MIAAGLIPNLGRTGDFRRIRRPRPWQRRMWPVLAMAPCLMFQGCGNSQNKPVVDSDAVTPRSVSSSGKGDILVARPSAATSQPRDSFADRYLGDSFADRYAASHNFTPSLARGPSVAAVERTASIPGSYKVASLSPELPFSLSTVKQA